MCIFIHTYLRMNIFARMCICTRAPSHTHTWFFITYIHTDTFKYIHVYTHIHIHILLSRTCIKVYVRMRVHAKNAVMLSTSVSWHAHHPCTLSHDSHAQASSITPHPKTLVKMMSPRKQRMTEIYSKSAHAGPYPATPAPSLPILVETHSFHPPPTLCPQILEWQKTGTKKAEWTRLLRKRCSAKRCWGLAVPYPSQSHCAIERPWLPEMFWRGTWRHSRWMMRESMRGI